MQTQGEWLLELRELLYRCSESDLMLLTKYGKTPTIRCMAEHEKDRREEARPNYTKLVHRYTK